jgi:hypothetical protein
MVQHYSRAFPKTINLFAPMQPRNSRIISAQLKTLLKEPLLTSSLLHNNAALPQDSTPWRFSNVWGNTMVDRERIEHLLELSYNTFGRYLDKATSQLTRPKSLSSHSTMRDIVKDRIKRRRVVAMALSKQKKISDDEDKTTNEGVGELLKFAASHTLGKGLGVSPSLIHSILTRHKANKEKPTVSKPPRKLLRLRVLLQSPKLPNLQSPNKQKHWNFIICIREQ